MKVIVKKPYLKYAIDQEIEVRPQDAALLLPRGVVALPGESEEPIKVPAKKMTTKKVIKK
jgi:hypothetical protein